MTTNNMNTYMKTNIVASTYEHRYAREQVETQGFGAFRAHFMMDLLTREFGKNLGLLFLHNLKNKRIINSRSIFSVQSMFTVCRNIAAPLKAPSRSGPCSLRFVHL